MSVDPSLRSCIYVTSFSFVQIFFREDIAEGWTRPTALITTAIMRPVELIILAESEWTVTQACEPMVIGPGLVI